MYHSDENIVKGYSAVQHRAAGANSFIWASAVLSLWPAGASAILGKGILPGAAGQPTQKVLVSFMRLVIELYYTIILSRTNQDPQKGIK